MKNLGQAGKHGEFYDIRLDVSEMVRLYCLSVIREGGDYGGVSFPSRGTCQLHEEIQRLYPSLAVTALDIMALDPSPSPATSEQVLQDLARVCLD